LVRVRAVGAVLLLRDPCLTQRVLEPLRPRFARPGGFDGLTFTTPHGRNLPTDGRKARARGHNNGGGQRYFGFNGEEPAYTQRPPSTSSTLPVRKEASLEARNSVALATSSMVAKRPSGTVALNWARNSGESPPMNVGNSGVSAMTGAIAHTRIPSGASSAAIDFDSRFTAPLEALYQVSPGRGRIPAFEPMLMISPVFLARMSGTTAWANRKIDFTLTARSRSHSSSSTSNLGARP